MKNVRIIVDSGCDLERSPHPKVTVVPITVRFGDDEFLDSVTISHRQFYEKLIESDVLPTTSLIPPTVFERLYAEAVESDEQVVVITLSSKLSGTYQSAKLAAEQFSDDVFVVDSLNVAIGEQVLVYLALSLTEKDFSAFEIAEILQSERSKVHTIALLDTLEYLKRGGRISKSVALVGGMLSMKPVVAVQDGEVAMLGTARGSKNGNNYLISEINKTSGVDFTRPYCIGYTGLDDTMMRKYIADSQSVWDGHSDTMLTCSIGATIGTHVGPGAVCVAFFEK